MEFTTLGGGQIEGICRGHFIPFSNLSCSSFQHDRAFFSGSQSGWATRQILVDIAVAPQFLVLFLEIERKRGQASDKHLQQLLPSSQRSGISVNVSLRFT